MTEYDASYELRCLENAHIHAMYSMPVDAAKLASHQCRGAGFTDTLKMDTSLLPHFLRHNEIVTTVLFQASREHRMSWIFKFMLIL